jgi:fluoride exporter
MAAPLAVTAYLWIALGGALGSVARFWMAGAVDGRLNAAAVGPFPWGTLAVNLLGSFIIGLLAGMETLGSQARLFLAVGLCGGFTTFSAFSLQTLNLLRDGLLLRAGGNILLSVLLCLVASWLGLLLTQRSV